MEAIDKNINAGIERLGKFQLPSGGFSFWPGGRQVSIWGTNYAGHFLLEAETRGYHVPAYLKEKWLGFQHSRSLTTQDNLTERVYRVYLLSLADRPAYGPMNLLRENNLKDMNNVQKWILASAYQLAGVEDVARRIVRNLGHSVKEYREFAGTYGSALRDKGLILEMATQMSLWDPADRLYEEITERLASNTWYSTQTTGYCLLAVGKYLEAQSGAGQPLLKGTIRLPDRTTLPFSTEDFAYKHEIEEGFGGRVTVTLDRVTTLERVPVSLEWEGVPLKSETVGMARNLTVVAEWFDDNGRRIDPARTRQGLVFWGHFKVSKTTPYRVNVEEVALSQIVPSGWEIENVRLTGETLPSWMQNYSRRREEYVDIRDDRISWFFDLPDRVRQADFVVKLQAVTEGTFFLPSAVCEAMYQNDFRAVLPGREVQVYRLEGK